ncbi:SIS domain-containing protein [Pleomorphomonas sp. NRK KF1]|uniref:D-sedoheptulose-7-phosphate isomerase n=1 Tax=Pleomorphomonas sp. NRK KF1 TaxID=2943000 RepID=UPI0020441AF0|nr:SIS domain-containing protein [Pleomorphomonas sp. NRK KF1]MCM5555150.1 SIS domain-containing protein [Pleomorphomonas sp. NRK KF1]
MAGLQDYLQTSIDGLAALRDHDLSGAIERAIDIIVAALSAGKPMLVCGNGGSAADAQHIAGELVGRFLRERKAYNVIALGTDTSVVTAWSNDYSFESLFARQVEAHGCKGAVLLAISTSGNSKNVLAAAEVARQQGMTVIALTGEGGGKLAPLADVLLDVPSRFTPVIQQGHLCLYHYLCGAIEERLVGMA